MSNPLSGLFEEDPVLGAPNAGDVFKDTVGSAVSGAAQADAIATGVTTGLDIAATVGTTVGGSVGAAIGTATGAAAGIAGAIGSAIPIPGIGAIIAALAALIAGLVGGLKDTFHPSPGIAAAWLTIFRFAPQMAMLNIDRAVNPIEGANLSRYFMIVSGSVKKGQRGNAGRDVALNNPNISTSCDNPYQCRVDPLEPLTDADRLQKVGSEFEAWAKLSEATDKNPKAKARQDVDRKLPHMVPPLHGRDPAYAQGLLAMIRKHPSAFRSINQWSEWTANANQIRAQLRALRASAGEHGNDSLLASIFGGDVTPYPEFAPSKPPPHPLPLPKPTAEEIAWAKGYGHSVGAKRAKDAKIGEAPAPQTIVVERETKSQPSRVVWFGLGALTFAGSLVGLVAWQVRKAQKKLETSAHKEQ